MTKVSKQFRNSLCVVLMVCLAITMYPLMGNGISGIGSGQVYAASSSGLTGDQRADVVKIAKSCQGMTLAKSKKKLKKYGKKLYKPNYKADWCAWWVSNVAKEAGVSTSVVPHVTYADGHSGTTDGFYTWAMSKGLYKSAGSYTPRTGDLALFGTSSSNIYHVELVESVTTNGTVKTIGGNTGGKSWPYSVVSKPQCKAGIYGYVMIQYPAKKHVHKANTKTGLCKTSSCKKPYKSWDLQQEKWDTNAASSNKQFYRVSQKTKALKLRVYPKTGNVIRVLSQGEAIKVIALKGGWYKVRDSKSNIGYVNANSAYVTKYTCSAAKSDIKVTLYKKTTAALEHGTKRCATGYVSSYNPIKKIVVKAVNPNTTDRNGNIKPTTKTSAPIEFTQFIFHTAVVGDTWKAVREFDLGSLSSGTWNISIVATDVAGQTKSSAVGTLVIHDKGVKTPTIIEKTDHDSNGKETKYALVTNNAGSGTTYIQIDDGKWTLTKNMTTKIRITGAASKKIRVYVRTSTNKRSVNVEKTIKGLSGSEPAIEETEQSVPAEVTGDQNVSGDAIAELEARIEALEQRITEAGENKAKAEQLILELEKRLQRLEDEMTAVTSEPGIEEGEMTESDEDDYISELLKEKEDTEAELEKARTAMDEAESDLLKLGDEREGAELELEEMTGETVSLQGTSIKKISKGKKKMTVKWKKQKKGVNGYQIRYSRKSNFSEGVSVVTVKNAKTTKKVIKHLKSKKRYYVQIRTYKVVDDTYCFSKWSKTKSVKVK